MRIADSSARLSRKCCVSPCCLHDKVRISNGDLVFPGAVHHPQAIIVFVISMHHPGF